MNQTSHNSRFQDPENIEDTEWYVQKSETCPTLIVKPVPGYVVCDIPRTQNMLKHAALLSAAPKLLKACKQARAAILSHNTSDLASKIDLGFLDNAIESATTQPSLPPDSDIDLQWNSEASPD